MPDTPLLLVASGLPWQAALAAELQRCGWQVRVHEGGLADPNVIAAAARGCDAVVHAAALDVQQRASVAAMYAAHVAGTENVLQAVRHAGCRRLVHISSADVSLAACARVNWHEERWAAGHARHAYVRTRRLAEELVVTAAQEGLETVALRPALLWSEVEELDVGTVPRGRGGKVRLVGSGNALLATTHIGRLAGAVDACLRAAQMPRGGFFVTDDEVQTAWEFFARWSQTRGLPPPQRGLLPGPWAYALACALVPFGAAPLPVLRLAYASHFDASRLARALG